MPDKVGETIEIALTFDRDLHVTGTPETELELEFESDTPVGYDPREGVYPRRAQYRYTNGTRTLHFSYTVLGGTSTVMGCACRVSTRAL